MRASYGSSRSIVLHIEGRPTEDSESGRLGGGLGSPTTVVVGVLPVGYLPLLDKGKEKISEIRYPLWLRISEGCREVRGCCRP